MKEIAGVITAMATPFGEDGRVDLDASRRLAAHLDVTGDVARVQTQRRAQR